MNMVGAQLAANGVAIGIGSSMQILIPVATTRWFHPGHREMVGIGTEHVNSLPEAQLDLESIAVELKDFQRGQREIGA